MRRGLDALVFCLVVGAVFAGRPCGVDEFRCESGHCIALHKRCDGRRNCNDGSDEENCLAENDKHCGADMFRCNDGECIPWEHRCDGEIDCLDVSDEEGCVSCQQGGYKCRNSQCIDHWRRCDGRLDCADSSDEALCDHKADINLKVYPEQQIARQGQIVVFRCRDEGNTRSTVLWSHADHLPPGSTDVLGRLTMPNIQPHHSGMYICKTASGRGSSPIAQKSAFLIVQPRNDLPSAHMEPEKQRAQEGDDVKIRCITSGTPAPGITFKKVDGNLTDRHLVQGDTLVIRRVALQDRGVYLCEAKNTAGMVRTVALLKVRNPPPPDMFRKKEHVTALVGSTVQLMCPLTNVSPSTIQWTKERKPRLPPNIRVFDGKLWIENIQKEDSGRYICVSRSEHGHPAQDYVILYVKDVPRVEVNIKASKDIVQMGDALDLHCLLSPNVKAVVAWTKLPGGGHFPDNVRVRGPVLSINGVKQENGGVYRCTTDGPSGIVIDNYALIIQDTAKVPQNVVETREAPYGSTVSLDCVTSVQLDGPVTYTWTKQNGSLSSEARPRHSRLTIPNIKSTDAGTYVCTAKSEHVSVEMPVVVVVTGLIPRFTQEPLSYMKLTTDICAAAEFEFEIRFKPENSNGLLLYNSEHKEEGSSSNHMLLALGDGFLDFKYQVRPDVGHVRSIQPIDMNSWHTVMVVKRSNYVALSVDHQPQVIKAFNAKGSFNWTHEIYIGNVPDLGQTSKIRGYSEGFVGCVSSVKLRTTEVDFRREAEMVGTTLCEGCAVNPCLHDGVCQELLSEEGYRCTCSPGFTGQQCENVGETCYPAVCGQGRCVNRATGGFDCYCPFGRTGYRCEKIISRNNLDRRK